MDFIPEVSTFNTNHIEVDKEILEMLHSLGISNVPFAQIPCQQNTLRNNVSLGYSVKQLFGTLQLVTYSPKY